MTSSAHEIVSHGLNMHDLMRECAGRFDMTPSSCLAVAARLFENNAISYPRAEGRFIEDGGHIDGAPVLAMLAASSPIWEAQIDATNAKYQSSVWVTDNGRLPWNASAIRPLATANVASLDRDEENVFSVIAERYIALFDPARSTPRGAVYKEEDVEYRRFSSAAHSKTVDIFGTSANLVGPEFFVDKGSGNIFLAVTDDVTGYAWLEEPLAAVSEFFVSMPFSSIEDFARRNLLLLRKFVDEANSTVLPDGGGLYVCAPNTYELRTDVRHYLWPRS
jgi:hypothetical protein